MKSCGKSFFVTGTCFERWFQGPPLLLTIPDTRDQASSWSGSSQGDHQLPDGQTAIVDRNQPWQSQFVTRRGQLLDNQLDQDLVLKDTATQGYTR